MNNYHIYIFSKSWVNSGMANIGQTLNMAQYFSNHAKTTIFLRGDLSDEISLINKILGVDPKFNIVINNKNIFFHIFSCIKKISKNSYNHIIFYSRTVPICIIMSLLGNKVILELHQDNFNRFKLVDYFLAKLINFNFFVKKIKIVTISNSLKEIIQKKFKLKHQIHVAHDASNIPNNNLLNLTKRKRKLVVYTGKLGNDRSVNHILELAKNDPTSDFRIIGGTLDQVREYRNEIRLNKILNLKVFKRQKFLRVQFYQCKADILIGFWSNQVATMNYCSPLKLFEYMQTGNKILLHDFNVFHEVIPKSSLIELCEPDNLDSELDAYKKLAAKKPKIDSRNKLLLYSKKYTYKKRAKSILNFYFNET
jgi:glycosyltransferase involved in cell wall biosynthesis